MICDVILLLGVFDRNFTFKLSGPKIQLFFFFFPVFIVIWLSCEFPPRRKKKKTETLFISSTKLYMPCRRWGVRGVEMKGKETSKTENELTFHDMYTHSCRLKRDFAISISLSSMFASPRCERGEFSSKSSWLLLELTKKWATTKANFTLVQTIPNSRSEWEYLYFRPTTTITGLGNSYEHRTYLSFL